MNKYESINWFIGMFLIVSGAYLVSQDSSFIGLVLASGGSYLLGATFEKKK